MLSEIEPRQDFIGKGHYGKIKSQIKVTPIDVAHLHLLTNVPTKYQLPTIYSFRYIYLFGVLCRFQHCTGHITTGSWNGRGNQYIQFVRVLYCKLPTNGKQLPAFPLEAVPGIEPRPQRWEARVLPLCHRGPQFPIYSPDKIYRSRSLQQGQRSNQGHTMTLHTYTP